MKEELESKPSIQFPDTSTNDSLVFGNMTPMIEIPSTIILRQREEEGIYSNMHMYVCMCMHVTVFVIVICFKSIYVYMLMCQYLCTSL